MKLYLGIDPGVTGAYAVINHELVLVAADSMPTHVVRTGKNRRCITYTALRDTLADIERQHGYWHMGYIERVWGQTGQGAVSAFAFGLATATALCVMEELGVPYNDITPNKWKKHYGLLGSHKGASVSLCKRYFPNFKMPLKKDHNKAEAVLLARLCWEENR